MEKKVFAWIANIRFVIGQKYRNNTMKQDKLKATARLLEIMDSCANSVPGIANRPSKHSETTRSRRRTNWPTHPEQGSRRYQGRGRRLAVARGFLCQAGRGGRGVRLCRCGERFVRQAGLSPSSHLRGGACRYSGRGQSQLGGIENCVRKTVGAVRWEVFP